MGQKNSKQGGSGSRRRSSVGLSGGGSSSSTTALSRRSEVSSGRFRRRFSSSARKRRTRSVSALELGPWDQRQVLFLGVGDSGKATMFKQLMSLYPLTRRAHNEGVSGSSSSARRRRHTTHGHRASGCSASTHRRCGSRRGTYSTASSTTTITSGVTTTTSARSSGVSTTSKSSGGHHSRKLSLSSLRRSSKRKSIPHSPTSQSSFLTRLLSSTGSPRTGGGYSSPSAILVEDEETIAPRCQPAKLPHSSTTSASFDSDDWSDTGLPSLVHSVSMDNLSHAKTVPDFVTGLKVAASSSSSSSSSTVVCECGECCSDSPRGRSYFEDHFVSDALYRLEHESNFDGRTQAETALCARSHLITAAATILSEAKTLYESNPVRYRDFFIDTCVETLIGRAMSILSHSSRIASEDGLSFADLGLEELGWALKSLCENESFRRVVEHRYGYFQLCSNADRWLSKCEAVFDPFWAPSREDWLCSRVRTTGIVKHSYAVPRMELIDIDMIRILEHWVRQAFGFDVLYHSWADLASVITRFVGTLYHTSDFVDWESWSAAQSSLPYSVPSLPMSSSIAVTSRLSMEGELIVCSNCGSSSVMLGEPCFNCGTLLIPSLNGACSMDSDGGPTAVAAGAAHPPPPLSSSASASSSIPHFSDFYSPMQSRPPVNVSFVLMGSQRNERRKWCHHYGNTTTVFYVASLTQFVEQLYEDCDTCSLDEDLALLSSILEIEELSWQPIVLFLTKRDILPLVLKSGVCLSNIDNYPVGDCLWKKLLLPRKRRKSKSTKTKTKLLSHFSNQSGSRLAAARIAGEDHTGVVSVKSKPSMSGVRKVKSLNDGVFHSGDSDGYCSLTDEDLRSDSDAHTATSPVGLDSGLVVTLDDSDDGEMDDQNSEDDSSSSSESSSSSSEDEGSGSTMKTSAVTLESSDGVLLSAAAMGQTLASSSAAVSAASSLSTAMDSTSFNLTRSMSIGSTPVSVTSPSSPAAIAAVNAGCSRLRSGTFGSVTGSSGADFLNDGRRRYPKWKGPDFKNVRHRNKHGFRDKSEDEWLDYCCEEFVKYMIKVYKSIGGDRLTHIRVLSAIDNHSFVNAFDQDIRFCIAQDTPPIIPAPRMSYSSYLSAAPSARTTTAGVMGVRPGALSAGSSPAMRPLTRIDSPVHLASPLGPTSMGHAIMTRTSSASAVPGSIPPPITLVRAMSSPFMVHR